MPKHFIPITGLILILLCCSGCTESSTEIPALKVINSLGEFTVKVTKDKITFAPEYGEMKAPLFYKDDFNELNFNGFYEIKNDQGEAGYFRFGWVEAKDSVTVLKNINWFYKDPPTTDGYTSFHFKTLQNPQTQEGPIKICTIGDSQTWWNHSAALRKEMDRIHKGFYFVGSNTDIYAYPHEAEGGNSTQQVLKRLDKIPKADYYTLLLGTNDWKNSVDKAMSNLSQITDNLLNRYPSCQMIYITPLPTTNSDREAFNRKLQKKYISAFKDNPRVHILHLGEKMSEKQNWQKEYLSYDGLHPSENGVKFMARLLAQKTIAIDSKKNK